jgi:hypothetical protein
MKVKCLKATRPCCTVAYSDKHHWFMFDVNEVISIFKSFSRDLGPNKKFSIFH